MNIIELKDGARRVEISGQIMKMPEPRTVVLKNTSTRVEIPVDTNKIIVNGTVYTSDVKQEIKNNRTMLPIANIARALGLKDGKDIIWDSKSKMVTIYRSIVVK